MTEHAITRGLVLLGCGKMGSAMLQGWLADGLHADRVHVIEPFPSDWLNGSGVHLNSDLPAAPDVVLVAVKPQMMQDALPSLQKMGNGSTLFLSVAAGISIENYEKILGSDTPIIRAMPNTPAAIGKGIQVGGRWRCHSVDHVPKVTCIPLECRVGGAKARLKLKQSLSFNFTLLFITL